MGDNRRGKLFAEFIHDNFKSVNRIADIADGNLITAHNLLDYYPNSEIIVFDPKIRARKNSNNIHCFKKCFYSTEKLKCDLIIGMHPDEGTGEIIDFAILNRLPFIICPCCLKGKYSQRVNGKHGWIKLLKTIAVNRNYSVTEKQLNMSGDNIVLMGRIN